MPQEGRRRPRGRIESMSWGDNLQTRSCPVTRQCGEQRVERDGEQMRESGQRSRTGTERQNFDTDSGKIPAQRRRRTHKLIPKRF
ncbi:hypothetical protein AMTR_s00037p00117200 [Amborella trichopoda]|uniref:Uncharacterized protein n=1 Tax=Amborella trichopoda TaxID=13333 RepID=U5D4F9_AMBTC|nr:hypothetical protein AMTR_s00037p00117200 [Amborella trichopoda]